MSTITITGLPSQSVVYDSSLLPVDTSGVTYKVTASTLKTYMSSMPSLTVSGALNATLSTSNQPNITSLGTLVGINTNGQIISTLPTGTSPLDVQSTTLVANLYAGRAALADTATNALNAVAKDTQLASIGGSDVIITGNAGNIVATLTTVNSTPGTYGGQSGTTYYIPQLQINSKGLVTVSGNVELDLNLSSQAVTSLQGTADQINVSNTVGDVTLSLPTQLTVNDITATDVIARTLQVNQTIVTNTVNAATIGNVSTALIGTVQTTAQPNITSLGTLTGLTVAGTATATNFAGPGYGLTNIPNSGLANSSIILNGTIASLGDSVTIPAVASTIVGSVLSSNVTTSSLTSIGTLTQLNVVGTVSVSGIINATSLKDSGNRVVTSITHVAGPGIGLSNQTTIGPNPTVTITNTGVTSLSAGPGINLNATTGSVVVANNGVVSIAGLAGINVSSSTGAVVITPSAGYNGYGARTISSAAPTPGVGNNGDIWYRI